ncbi:uncharacterized protein [Dysidea avara]|uniref:uncharacterized protein n=1 Tax=Dysidea avara TaxID=196820 RepID=UPI0033328296
MSVPVSFAFLMLIGAICFSPAVNADKQIQVVETILPYHQLMTPDWIHSYFTITGPFTLYPQYYEIPAGTVAHQQTLQLQLVAPGILSTTDSITVTITVAMDTGVAQGDHDPRFGISDGK